MVIKCWSFTHFYPDEDCSIQSKRQQCFSISNMESENSLSVFLRLKWPIRFYTGKDLCTEGELQLLLHFTRAALPTWLSQGINIASSLKTMSQLQFWWQMYCQNNKSYFAVDPCSIPLGKWLPNVNHLQSLRDYVSMLLAISVTCSSSILILWAAVTAC